MIASAILTRVTLWENRVAFLNLLKGQMWKDIFEMKHMKSTIQMGLESRLKHRILLPIPQAYFFTQTKQLGYMLFQLCSFIIMAATTADYSNRTSLVEKEDRMCNHTEEESCLEASVPSSLLWSLCSLIWRKKFHKEKV